MMKKFVPLLALTLCCCLLVAGCGADSTDNIHVGQPLDIQPLPDLKVEECYTYSENEDGTFSYSVKGRSGMYILDVRNSHRPAKFAVIDEDTLVIHGTSGTGRSARWATFCNIATNTVSDTFGGFLAALNNRVAFVDARSGGYHVFVCDPFEPNEYEGVHTLEGLSILDGEDPVTDFVLSGTGVLSVTYAVEGGHKTIEIDLNPAQDK